jgi:4-aminobutyrate aminotransferase
VPGSHGGTFGGNAVACAAAVATIRAIREEGLLENAVRMGSLLTEGLRTLQSEFPVIGDVRGLGLMIATEFTAPDGAPATSLAKAVVKGCLKRWLMLLTCGPLDNTIRWIPPLVITPAHVEEALAAFREALAEAVA